MFEKIKEFFSKYFNKTEPKYIMQNDKGRAIQARHLLNELEKSTGIPFETMPTAKVESEIIKHLDETLKRGNITSADGIKASFSKESIGKMISDSAVKASVNNGFSRGEHLAVVYNADKIFSKATLLEKHADKQGRAMTIYRLTSPLTNETQAFWTIREAIKQNKKAYSVELQLIPNSVITDKLPRTDAKLGSLSSLDEGGSRQNAPTTIAKTDKPNPTTKKQISQEQKKQAHLAREAGIKKSLDLLKKKQSKSADTAVSNISSDSIKNETKPKFRKMFQRKDNINNKDKK